MAAANARDRLLAAGLLISSAVVLACAPHPVSAAVDPQTVLEVRLAYTEPGPGLLRFEHENRPIFVAREPLITDSDFLEMSVHQGDDGIILNGRCTPEAHTRLLQSTDRHAGKPLAILWKGQFRGASTVQSRVGCARVGIGWSGTKEEADSLAAAVQRARPLPPPRGDQHDAEPGSVVIAIIDDYPAFRPDSAATPWARRDLRAIVLERDEVDHDRSLVIIHPEHVTPEVLYTALAAVTGVLPRRGDTNIRLVTAGRTVPADRIPPSAHNALEALIADIQQGETRPLRGQRPARYTVLDRAEAAQLLGAEK